MRITPTPGHTIEQQAVLINALESVWAELELPRHADWVAVGGRAGVGHANAKEVPQLWTPEQLGLRDGTAPARLTGNVGATTQKQAQIPLGPISGGRVETGIRA